MTDVYLPLVTGLIGALIGSLTSIATIVVQSHYQGKIASKQKAIEAAIENFKCGVDILIKKGGQMPPLGIYIYYHVELLKLIEKNRLSPEALIRLADEQEKLIKAIKEYGDGAE